MRNNDSISSRNAVITNLIRRQEARFMADCYKGGWRYTRNGVLVLLDNLTPLDQVWELAVIDARRWLYREHENG